MTGHTVNPAPTGGDRVDIEQHHLPIRMEFRQQLKGPGIRRSVTKRRRNHRPVDHEVVDVAGSKIRGVATEPALSRIERWRQGMHLQLAAIGIRTESCWVNPNRNPGWSKAEVEEELKERLGLRKIIWLPGIKGKDITDAHVDFYARFVKPGVVIANLDNDPESYDHKVTLAHLDILKSAVALIRHVPTAWGGRLRAQGRKADGRCHAHAGYHRHLLDELTTRRHGAP